MRVRPTCQTCNKRPADVDKGQGVYRCAKCEMDDIYDRMSARDRQLTKSRLWSTIVATNRNKQPH